MDDLFDQVPAIAIDGAKAVGKTTTAEQRVLSQLKLDSKVNRESIQADPELLRSRMRPLLIDEWQKVPEVWDVVRRAVDEDRTGGQFLLVGSAAPAPGATAHSGAGRIGRLRMRPMTLSERGACASSISLSDLVAGHISTAQPLSDSATTPRRSWPPGFLGCATSRARALKFHLDSYVRNAVDRDVPEQGLAVRRPAAMLAWLRAYAAATSSTTSCSHLFEAATAGQSDKAARSTSIAYRDVLTQVVAPGPPTRLGTSWRPARAIGAST